MRHFDGPVVIVLLAAIGMALRGAPVLAAWELYDDFQGGVLSAERWVVDDSSAVISVEKGKVRFEHLAGHPNDGSYLVFSQGPELIKAVQTTIRVESCSGDVRPQILGVVGSDSDGNFVVSTLDLMPAHKSIGTKLLAEQLGEGATLRPLYWLHESTLRKPLEIIGESFTLTAVFTPGSIANRVRGIGESLFIPVPKLNFESFSFKGIGTVSPGGQGPCVAYFEKVHVLY